MLHKHSLYYHTFGAPMATRNKQVSSVLVGNALYASSFTSGTDGWVATSNATLSNVYGNIRATVTALNAGMQKTFSTEAGKTYRIKFKVNLRGWPYMYVKDVASTTNLISITDFMTPGDYSYTFTATGYQTNVIFHEAGNASGSVQICNFTLEEVEAENGYRFGFNGKENDGETQTQDYGMRIYDYRLGKFLSVDPLTSKYPMLTPYQFASNTPIQAIDLDGLEAFGCTTILYSESGASIGMGYGLTATISGGTAYDMIGKTHFSAYSALNPSNQDLYDGSRNPKIIYGLDINAVTTGFNIVKAATFERAFNKQNGSFPVTKISAKFGVGPGISISDKSFGLSIGLGFGGTFKTGSQSNILQSISFTYNQAEKIDALGGITTLSKPIAINENGQVVFQSSILVRKENSKTFVDSGIKVYSKSKEVKDEKTGKTSIEPDGQFKTKEYSSEEDKKNKNGN